MSDPFPSLLGLSMKCTRRALYSTLVQTVASGGELRVQRWPGTKFHYTLSFEFLRRPSLNSVVLWPNAGEDEVAALVKHIEQSRGAYDSFDFIDPVDGHTRRCRYVSDDIEWERIAAGLWIVGEIELVTVVEYKFDVNGNEIP